MQIVLNIPDILASNLMARAAKSEIPFDDHVLNVLRQSLEPKRTPAPKKRDIEAERQRANESLGTRKIIYAYVDTKVAEFIAKAKSGDYFTVPGLMEAMPPIPNVAQIWANREAGRYLHRVLLPSLQKSGKNLEYCHVRDMPAARAANYPLQLRTYYVP